MIGVEWGVAVAILGLLQVRAGKKEMRKAVFAPLALTGGVFALTVNEEQNETSASTQRRSTW